MKRTLKILLALVLGLIALLLLAVVVLPYVVDPNNYRDDLERIVHDRTGRELEIRGRIELSLFPWLGARVGAATLGNAPGFGPEPFARMEAADVRVRVWPLLWGRVEVGTVVLRGAEVALARNERGRTNWADLAARPETPAPAEPAAPGSRDPGAGGMLAALTVGGLEVRQARIAWADAVNDTHWVATDLDLSAGAVRPGAAFPVELDFRLRSDRPRVTGTVRLTGRVTAVPGEGRYRLADGRVATELESPLLPGGATAAVLEADLAADLPAGTARIQQLALAAYGGRLTAEGAVTGLRAEPAVEGRVRAEAQDGERMAALLKELVPGPTWGPEALAGSYLKGELRGGTGPDGLRLQEMEGSLLGLHLRGAAGVRRPQRGPLLHADLTGEVTRGGRLLSPVRAALPPGLRPAALDGARLDLRGEMAPVAGRLSLSALRLAAVGAVLRASGSAQGLNGQPTGAGRVTLEPFSPRRVLTRLGLPVPETADSGVLTEAALETGVAMGSDGLRLEGMRLSLDQSRLTGSVGLPSLTGPVVRFALNLNGIDLDRYLPPADGEAAASPGSAAGPGAGQLPLEPLRRVDVAGRLDVGRLKVRNLQLEGVRVAVDGREGRFRLHPLSARLYGGEYAGDVRLDVRGAEPAVSLNERLNGVAVGPLLRDTVGKAYLRGTADLRADLGFRGATPRAILNSLDGEGRYALRDGAVLGLDLERALTAAYAALGKGKEQAGEGRVTEFRELRGSATVAEGRIRSEDLTLRTPLLAVVGQGALDLAGARLDYRLGAEVRQGAGGGLAELEGLTVPLRVTGPVGDPKIRVDLGRALKGRAQKALEAEKEKAESRLEEELKEKQEELRRDLEDKARELFDF
jgi:AsmA protein